MARTYAGILGIVALLTVLARGLLHDADPESTVFAAWCSLVVFCALGYALGALGGRIAEESVRANLAAEVAASQAASSTNPKNPPA